MKIRPGPGLLRIGGALVGLSFLVFLWQGAAWLLAVALLPVAVLIRSDYRALKRSFQHLTVHRSLPAVVGREMPFDVILEVANSGPLPVHGELRDEVPREAQPPFAIDPVEIPPGGVVALRREFRIPVRGRFDYGPVWLSLHGSYGLLDAVQSLPCPGSVKVYPEGFVSRDSLTKQEADQINILDKLARVKQQGVGTEFESLSEFREGDDPRRIDWRTTARYRRPIVRRFQVERHRDVMLIIDCGRLMGGDGGKGTKLDCAVDAALMLGRVAVQNGDRCGVGLFDDRVLGYLPPQAGPQTLRMLTDSVFNVQSRWRESDFSLMFATMQARQSKRALVVILSDIMDAETSEKFRASLATLARRHVVVFAALQTPLLGRLIRDSVESLLDGYRKAVSFRMLRERERAIHALKRSGVHVLDVEPAHLTVPLINQFVELRGRNVL